MTLKQIRKRVASKLRDARYWAAHAKRYETRIRNRGRVQALQSVLWMLERKMEQDNANRTV